MNIINAIGWNDSGGCICVDGLSWVTESNACIINCSTFANTIGNNGNTACLCKANYIWIGTECLEQCAVITFGTSTSCTCPYGYYLTDNGCIVDCSVISHSNGTNK